MLAMPTARTSIFKYFRDRNGIARFISEFDGAEGADFVAYHASFLLLPCQAPFPGNDRRTCFRPNALLDRQVSDGSCRASSAAAIAFRAAGTATGRESRAEEPGKACLPP